MMPLFDTDAIVLREYEFREADKIISLYSKDRGKVRVIAKGVRKIKSTLAAGLQPFTYSHILVYQGKSDLGKLSQCDIKESFKELRFDISKMAYASYVVELINELTIDYKSDALLFNLLLLTLRLLDRLDDSQLIIRTFELKLLKRMGYAPYLNNCIKCGNDLNNRAYFSNQGGVICYSCANQGLTPISLGTVKSMGRILNLDYRQLDRLKLPNYVRKELGRIIPEYIQYIIGKRLKSIKFLKSLEELN